MLNRDCLTYPVPLRSNERHEPGCTMGDGDYHVQIKQRDEQIESLQQQIFGLERTRDRCTTDLSSCL